MLAKRLTLIVRGERIEPVYYPILPPIESTNQVSKGLKDYRISS